MAPTAPRRFAFAACAAFLALSACETVQFGPDPADPRDTVKTEATLQFTNKRETDPGPLVVLLYPATAKDVEDAVPVKEFPEVAFDQSSTLKVAAGRYKLAYRMESGDLHPMPLSGSEGLDAEWPAASFAPGKTYQLLIETDAGNHTRWRHDIPVSKAP